MQPPLLAPPITSSLNPRSAEFAENRAAMLEKLSAELSKALGEKLAKLMEAGLLEVGRLGLPGELGDLSGFAFADHECDENCKPGGT